MTALGLLVTISGMLHKVRSTRQSSSGRVYLEQILSVPPSATTLVMSTDGESNLRYTNATIAARGTHFIDVSFTAPAGDLRWVIFDDLSGAYQYFVNRALPNISILRTLWRLAPEHFTHGRTHLKDEPLPDFDLYAKSTNVQDETWQLADGSYITKYDWSNAVRDRDFYGLNVVQDTSHFRVGQKTTQPVGKVWGPWLWYLNNGSIPDVEKKRAKELKHFPYKWLDNSAYRKRGGIEGTLLLSDGRPASKAGTNDKGRFSFDDVRTGSYGLIAYSNGSKLADVYTNFTKSGITVTKDKTLNLGRLKWNVADRDKRIFQVGDFDKKALGFKNGGLPYQHGVTEDSPANLTFVVGKSKTADWYYASSAIGKWTIEFEVSAAEIAANKTAILSVSLAGYSQSGALNVDVNGQDYGTLSKDNLTSDPALYRSGKTSGEWRFIQHRVEPGVLVEGVNRVGFSVTRYTKWRGFLLDSIILEWE
ncbi:hypothetical protein BN1708_008848 [Verticillium longisporum]|uniref:rhamnogalacturonan endolyase n=1 Tax=Verticillium longisporum TaxID=100787 RepID=A0A0G4N8G4_VERLO|nr:hypothetical protein BN1708_008848 [Verticillium longisporum]